MIINPMWFYWMSVFDILHIICLVIGMITGFIGGVALFCYLDDNDNDTLRDAKRLLLLALCFGSVGIFTPSEL